MTAARKRPFAPKYEPREISLTMAANQTFLAVDFGTSNSYFTEAGYGSAAIKPTVLEGNQPGVTTAILYRENGSPIIGDKALQAFGTSDQEERRAKGYRLAMNFKPDIVRTPQARQSALDFLREALKVGERNRTHFDPLRRKVYFGVPCEASPKFRTILKEIAGEAGYGNIETLSEPLGPVYDGLHQRQITLRQALSGILVIDFGGGTCDFAWMKQGRVVHSWGDMNLGGRLFDDLFYQWFAEQQPDLARKIENDGEDFYVRTYQCRLLKERFSETVTQNPEDDYADFINSESGRGRLKNLSRQEFLQRARNYRPSKTFLDFLSETSASLPEKLRDVPIDLVQWFEDSCLQGVRQYGIPPDAVGTILLAGGSSSWFFVDEFCRNVLDRKPEQIQRSSQPFAAVSQGLACYELVRHGFKLKKQRLEEDKEAFSRRIAEEFKEIFLRSEQKLVARLVTEIFDREIKPELIGFRQSGGKIIDLEKKIDRIVRDRESAIREIIHSAVKSACDDFELRMRKKIADWLKQHGLDPEFGAVMSKKSDTDGTIDVKTPDPIGDIFNAILAAMIGMLVAAIGVAVMSGGFALGPIGWIILIVTPFVMGYTRERTIEAIKGFSLPSQTLYFLLTDKAIQNCRNEMRTKLSEKIHSLFEENQGNLFKMLDDGIDSVIRDITELSNAGPASEPQS